MGKPITTQLPFKTKDGDRNTAIHTLTSRGSLRFSPLVHPWKEQLCDKGLEWIQPTAEDGMKELQWDQT